MKTCTSCDLTKPLTDYVKRKSSSDGYSYVCKLCKSTHRRAYYALHPDKQSQYKRRKLNHSFMANYNITIEQYDDMAKSQDYLCKICNQSCTLHARLCVDHDHKTSQVRGLLCNACNTGLGHFKDDVETIERAIAYLKINK